MKKVSAVSSKKGQRHVHAHGSIFWVPRSFQTGLRSTLSLSLSREAKHHGPVQARFASPSSRMPDMIYFLFFRISIYLYTCNDSIKIYTIQNSRVIHVYPYATDLPKRRGTRVHILVGAMVVWGMVAVVAAIIVAHDCEYNSIVMILLQSSAIGKVIVHKIVHAVRLGRTG
jgi:hypothetical protein